MTLSTVQKEAWVWGIALVVAVSAFGGFVGHERAVGRLEVAVADDVTVMKALRRNGDSIQVVYRTDTVQSVQRLTHTDTVLARIVDTAIVHHHDSVYVSVATVAHADTSIHACLVIKADCEQGWANAKLQVQTLSAELQKVKQLQPSPWLPHLGVGVAAGINTQSKFDAVAGLTFAWKIP